MTFSVGTSSVKKGESLRDTVADDRGDGHRRDRRAPRVGGRAVAGRRLGRRRRSINAGDGWHEHPTQALLDCYTIRAAPRRRSTGCASRSSATSSTAGSPAPTCSPSPRSAPRSRWSRRPRCCRRASTGWPVDGQPRPRRRAARGRRRLPAAHAARAHDRGAAARRCASTPPRYGLTAEPGRARCADDALVMHPGPMNRGVEIAAEVADLPALGDHRAGRQRRRRAHGGAVPRCSASGGDRWLSVTVVIKGGTVVDETGERARRRRVVRRRSDRRGRRPASTRAHACSTPAGCVVAPGLVDLHTHLREPGREEAETIETGARAAALGGYTAVVAHAEHRAGDRPRRGRARGARARRASALCDVRVAGRITVGRAGRAARADGRDGRRSACASSPTTATACRTPR